MKNGAEKVAVIGPDYTFSHIAAIKNFPDKDILFCKNIADVVKRVSDNKADYGLVPFWNTNRYYIRIAQQEIINSKNLGIVDIFKMRVNLCLCSTARDIKQIKTIYTIKAVFDQCDAWLSRQLSRVTRKEANSTSHGIKKVLSSKNHAAIGSSKAARFYNINILADDIQNKSNDTLFFVIKKGANFPRKMDNFTLVTYPLLNSFRTKYQIRSLLLDSLLMPTNEWPIMMDSRKAKWHILEVPGHKDDMNIRTFAGKLSRGLRGSRILGCYDKRITDVLNSTYRFNSK